MLVDRHTGLEMKFEREVTDDGVPNGFKNLAVATIMTDRVGKWLREGILHARGPEMEAFAHFIRRINEVYDDLLEEKRMKERFGSYPGVRPSKD